MVKIQEKSFDNAKLFSYAIETSTAKDAAGLIVIQKIMERTK